MTVCKFNKKICLFYFFAQLITLRKNNPPAGRTIRCELGSFFSNSPSLYQEIAGVGEPSALQFNVTGS